MCAKCKSYFASTLNLDLKSMQKLVLFLLAVVPLTPVFANVSLPPLVSDNMLLQQCHALVWGKADPGENVTIKIGEVTAKTSAGEHGMWQVKLEGIKAGFIGDMNVSGKNNITVKNVAVGDVWVCGGQSNMDMNVKGCAWSPNGGVLNYAQEIADANYPAIRMFTVQKKSSETPVAEVNGQWEVCSPQTVARWSATSYFFGRKLHQDLSIPIGLIHASWGGSNASAWTPAEVLQGDPQLKAAYYDPRQAELANFPALKEKHEKETLPAWKTAVDAAKAANNPLPIQPKGPIGPGWCDTASALYNGMIFGLTKCDIKGIVWYQGETNGRTSIEAMRYRRLLPAMIASWRKAWGASDLPFYIVQIANFKARSPEPTESNWAEVREVQRQTAELLPPSGLVVTIDIGEEKCVHPVNKQDVGNRLALVAEGNAYGKGIVSSGPAFDKATFAGATATVTFKAGTAVGLSGEDGAKIKGFALAGTDKKFFWADAKIVSGESKDSSIILTAPEVPQPVAVRYAWADNPEVNLINNAGLPSVPFRTDDCPQVAPILPRAAIP